MNALSRIYQRIKRIFIQEVPNDMYACETCDETTCLEHDWENCQYRLRSQKFLDIKKVDKERSQSEPNP